MDTPQLVVLNLILLMLVFAVNVKVHAVTTMDALEGEAHHCASAVADATGRTLTLGGTFDLDIVPSPAIVRIVSRSSGCRSASRARAAISVGHSAGTVWGSRFRSWFPALR